MFNCELQNWPQKIAMYSKGHTFVKAIPTIIKSVIFVLKKMVTCESQN